MKDFRFLFISCICFLLLLRGKMFNFWTLVNILQFKFIQTKTPLISKGTTPNCKYDTRFSIPPMVSKVHFPNEWNIQCKSLESASQALKLCSEFLISATVLNQSLTNKNCASPQEEILLCHVRKSLWACLHFVSTFNVLLSRGSEYLVLKLK